MPARRHEPTDVQRAEVAALVSFGVIQIDIAKYIGIDHLTLDKYYRKELDTAVTSANAQVAKRLYTKATKGDDLAAQIFWLKTRAKWRTTDRDEDRENDEEKANNAMKEEIKDLRAKLAEKSQSEF